MKPDIQYWGGSRAGLDEAFQASHFQNIQKTKTAHKPQPSLLVKSILTRVSHAVCNVLLFIYFLLFFIIFLFYLYNLIIFIIKLYKF